MRQIRIATLLLATFAANASSQQPADLILHGARVWTGDGSAVAVRSIAIGGERIIAVGTEQEIARHQTSTTRSINIANAFISPGFIDNHTHFQNAGSTPRRREPARRLHGADARTGA